MSPLIKRRLEYFLVFFVYLAITLVIFWRRLPYLSTRYGMPDIDSDGTLWYLWARAFAQQHAIYFDFNNSLFGFPVGFDFSYIPLFSLIYEFGVFFVSWLGGSWSSVVLFANLSNISAYPLAALSAFGLAYYVTRDKYASFIAGLIFSFSYYHISMGRGFMSTNHIEFIPLYFLSLLYVVNKKTTASVVLSALVLSIAFMCNAYLAFFCGLLSFFFFFITAEQKTRSAQIRFGIKYYCIVLSVLLLTNVNYFITQSRVFNASAFATLGRTFEPMAQTVNVFSFFAPSSENWLYSFSGTGNNFLGYAALGLGFVGLILLKNNKTFLLFFFCFLFSIVLASNIPGFFFVNKMYFSVFGMFRAVSRLNILTSLFLSLMAAMTVGCFSQKYLWVHKK